LPTTSGTVITTGSTFAGTGPLFYAYRSATQALTINTLTKVAFDLELYDTNSNFNTTTNRFTPTVAGYYNLNGAITWQNTAVTSQNYFVFYKNGVDWSYSSIPSGPYNTNLKLDGSTIVYMNGSTDYIEVYALIGVTSNLLSGSGLTYFSGFLARAA
jgi:hypothetical protein